MDSQKDIPLRDFRFAHKGAIPFESIYIPGSSGPRRVDFSRPNRVNFYEKRK
jgi:hypothetical protein